MFVGTDFTIYQDATFILPGDYISVQGRGLYVVTSSLNRNSVNIARPYPGRNRAERRAAMKRQNTGKRR